MRLTARHKTDRPLTKRSASLQPLRFLRSEASRRRFLSSIADIVEGRVSSGARPLPLA